MICSGVFTALITPFDSQSALDIEGFRLHVRRQKEAEVSGLVIAGTTAEASLLSTQEREILITVARQETNLPLMVGCNASSTAQTTDYINQAADLGADSALVGVPYYIKPSQEGVFRHYEAVSRASPIPILAYNNPSRTGVNIDIETLKRIAPLKNVCGVKESSENISQICEIFYSIKRERPDFALICGDDMLTFSVMALGGDGVISGGANLIAEQMVALVESCRSGKYERARELHTNLMPIFKALKLETHPIPLKAALRLLGLPSGPTRLPLTPLQSKHLTTIESALSSLHGQTQPQFSQAL